METFYTAYTKLLNCETYYFVKKFTAFPEFKDVSPILDAYGMNSSFDKACSIAGVKDAKIKEQLLQQIDGSTPKAKVVEWNSVSFANKSIAG